MPDWKKPKSILTGALAIILWCGLLVFLFHRDFVGYGGIDLIYSEDVVVDYKTDGSYVKPLLGGKTIVKIDKKQSYKFYAGYDSKSNTVLTNILGELPRKPEIHVIDMTVYFTVENPVKYGNKLWTAQQSVERETWRILEEVISDYSDYSITTARRVIVEETEVGLNNSAEINALGILITEVSYSVDEPFE